ncbi:hypothetical protein HDF16_005600 [Granulicella aggregans]|uniref:Uncharacterized protein n=1 Tax=Granulicella aggregans TaxID=474949 RepID=A0A7W7ZJ37_9BACT|nr:hypothetical protein [Granulicella aggregans]
MLIHSRAPILALTTALTCGLTAGLLLLQRAWLSGAASTVIGAGIGIWQARITFYLPLLVVDEEKATLYQEGEDEIVFELCDLTVVQGDSAIGLAVFVTALLGLALGAYGLIFNVDAPIALSQLPTERVLLIGLGVWLCATAGSIAYLDLPRRKLHLRVASGRSRKIYIDNRRQREELLLFLKARRLEDVMLRVGLDPLAGVRKRHSRASTSGTNNEVPR